MMTDLTALSWHPYMKVEEFAAMGYLQEVNRHFFHPLGMMLVVSRDGVSLTIKGVIDCREDVAGVCFDTVDDFTTHRRGSAAKKIARLWAERGRDRLDECGYMIQPLDKL